MAHMALIDYSKIKFRRLCWKLFGCPDLPPKPYSLVNKFNQFTSKGYTPRYQRMAVMYLADLSIEVIADQYNVTRERVRQNIWKAYRDYETRITG